MRSFFLLAVVCGLFAGAILAAQPGANGTLARRVAHPLHASLISFGSGLAILTLVSILWGVFPPRIVGSVREIPWWAWFGGAIGAVLVTSSLIFAPKTGGLVWLSLVISGQIIAALALDHFGWAGYPQQPVNAQRLLGAILLIVGVLLVVRG